jgi:hypothetical protein
MTARAHDDRKGHHYYTPASQAHACVYSSDDPCGHHAGALIMRGQSSWGGAPSSCSPLTPIPLISSHDLLLIALRHISLSGGLTLVSMPQEREERRGHHRRNQCHNHQHGKEGWRENSQVQTNVKHD